VQKPKINIISLYKTRKRKERIKNEKRWLKKMHRSLELEEDSQKTFLKRQLKR